MQVDFKKYKKIYWDIKLPDSQVKRSWEEIRYKISNPTKVPFPALRYRVVFLSLFFLSLIGIAGFAQAAAPGAKLYPVKILSEKVAAKVSGRPQIILERRAEELIKASKSKPEKIEEANKHYQKALEETGKAVEDYEDKKKSRVNRSLEKQEQKLEETIKENPSSEKELKEALKNTKALKEKLKKDSK